MTELPTPPAWAQTLLAIMVAPEAHDGIAGDLIEEFRAEKMPQLGLPRANRWYAGQVAGYVWRSSWPWMVVLASIFVAQDLLNGFRRADGTTYMGQGYDGMPILPLVAAPAALLVVGFSTGRRTHSIVAGLVTASLVQISVLLVMGIWWNATLYPFAHVMQRNPYWIAAWHFSAADGESFMHWSFYDNIGGLIMMTLVYLPAAFLLGTIGALAGKLSTRQG